MKVDPFTHQMIRFLSAMHVATYRMFGGIGWLNRNTLILTTRGRKSGRAIDKPLLYYQEEGKAYLVASYGGSDAPPAWYLAGLYRRERTERAAPSGANLGAARTNAGAAIPLQLENACGRGWHHLVQLLLPALPEVHACARSGGLP